jgi:hypothetical protein
MYSDAFGLAFRMLLKVYPPRERCCSDVKTVRSHRHLPIAVRNQQIVPLEPLVFVGWSGKPDAKILSALPVRTKPLARRTLPRG